MMKGLWLSVTIAACALVGFATGSFGQTKPTEWRIHTPHGEGRSEFVMQKEWADALTKESGGRLKVTLYPFNALGFKDSDMLRIVPQGVIEGYMAYAPYIVRDDPITALTSPEMILYQREHFVNFQPAAHEIYKKRLSNKWKIRVSATYATPACYTGVIGKQPFNTLASMKGKKIRAWELQQVDTFKKLGIPTQMMAQSELYLALKSGVLDGAIYLTTPYLSTSMYEIAPYWSTLYMGTSILGLAVSERAFNALPADLQSTIAGVETKLMKKWHEEAIGWCKTYDDATLDELKKKGAHVLEPFSKQEQQVVVEKGLETWRDRAKELGPEAVEYQKTLEEAWAKARP